MSRTRRTKKKTHCKVVASHICENNLIEKEQNRKHKQEKQRPVENKQDML